MTDINTGANPLFLREEDLRQGIEMLFFAYRDFTGEADEILEEIGLGRAHHRAIYFIGRNPGITVSELLSILRITKQSLSRVLGELVRQGHVRQTPGAVDRRQRCLALTDSGDALERKLSETQRRRVARAYRQAGAEAVEGFRKVLAGIMDDAADAGLQAPANEPGPEHDGGDIAGPDLPMRRQAGRRG